MALIGYKVEWAPAGSFVDMPGVLTAELSIQSASGPNGASFGGAVEPSATISATAAVLASAWKLVPVRISLNADGGLYVPRFSGIITGRQENGESVSFDCGSYFELIRRAKGKAPLLYRRPIATPTTVTSIEDPANPAYRGGLLNRIFWIAGGRPSAQAMDYPAAAFYYQCDGTGFAPEWSWIDSENLLDEAYALAEAAGGQIYQDNAGVVSYVSPLALAEPPVGTPYTFTNSRYGTATQEDDAAVTVSAVTCHYARRALQPRQPVVTDRTARSVPAGGTLVLDLAVQWPIWRYGAVIVTGAYYTGEPATITATITTSAAQSCTISIPNPASIPLLIDSIVVEGDPIAVEGEGVARYVGAAEGPYTAELQASDSLYTQTEDDAARRCRMIYDFFGITRPRYVLSGCPLDLSRYVGEYVLYTNTRRSITDRPCRITAISIARSGESMQVSLVDLTGLPRFSDFFIVDRAYADGDTREVGY